MNIKYILYGNVGERSTYEKGAKDTLSLDFSPAVDGYILACNSIYRVKNGKVSIPVSSLPAGTVSLRLECDGCGYTLEKFENHGGDISIPKTDEETLRRLLARMKLLEDKVASLSDTAAMLEEISRGHHIFN